MIVEGGADSDHPWSVDAPHMLLDPGFLFRQPEADPDDVRLRCIDSIDDALIFFGAERLERR